MDWDSAVAGGVVVVVAVVVVVLDGHLMIADVAVAPNSVVVAAAVERAQIKY